MTSSPKEENLFHANYESGKQELFALLNEQNGFLPDDLRESVVTISKYLPYDSRPTELLQRVHTIWENFPTIGWKSRMGLWRISERGKSS